MAVRQIANTYLTCIFSTFKSPKPFHKKQAHPISDVQFFNLSGAYSLLVKLYTDINDPDSLSALVGYRGAPAQLCLPANQLVSPSYVNSHLHASQYGVATLYPPAVPPLAQPSQQHDNPRYMHPFHAVPHIGPPLQGLMSGQTSLQLSSHNDVGRSVTSTSSNRLSFSQQYASQEEAWSLGQWKENEAQPTSMPPNRLMQTQIMGEGDGAQGRGSLLDFTPTFSRNAERCSGFNTAVYSVLQALRSGEDGVVPDMLQRLTMGAACRLSLKDIKSESELQLFFCVGTCMLATLFLASP